MRLRALALLVPVAGAAVLLGGCTAGQDGPERASGSASARASASAQASSILAGYTDPGDGCEQAVSAIGYAEFRLKPLGQERFQDWDDATSSRVAAVAGTIELEMADFPDDTTRSQARRVADLATVVVDPDTAEDDRLDTFREYRLEAAQLVIDCAAAVDGI